MSQGRQSYKEEEEFNEPAPDFTVIKIIAKDGITFHMDLETAKTSSYLERLFAPGSKFKEALTGEVHLPWIRGEVMEVVCDYMHWKRVATKYIQRNMSFKIPPEVLVEVTVASDFLQV